MSHLPALRTVAAARSRVLDAPGRLLGRDRELGEARAALDAGRPVVVSGEAGIGKTALLHAALAGRATFLGGALGTLSSIPLLAVRRAVGSLPDGDPALAARAVLERVGTDAVLAVDDLHWADDASIEVIIRVGDHMPVVVAVRTGDARATTVLKALVRAGFVEVRLGGLGETDALALTRASGASLGSEAARSIVAATGGNPLLIEEVARGGMTTSLRLALEHRLRGLDPASRRVLEVLAFARAPVALSANRPAVHRLVEAGLAAVVEGGVEVRHALIADVVVQASDPHRRASVHRAVARVVGEPAEAARHLAAAGDRAAAREVAEAAVATSTLGQQVRLRAIAAEYADGNDAPELCVAAAEALRDAGLAAEAEHLVALVPDTQDELGARRWGVLARTRWLLGDAKAALAAGEAGLRIVRGSGSETEAHLLVEHAGTHLKQRQAASAAALAREGFALLELLGRPLSRARRIHAVALMISEAPRSVWEEMLREAQEDARREGDVDAELAAGEMLVSANESGDPILARHLAGELIAVAHAHGLLDTELSIRVTVLSTFNSQGEFELVVAEGFRLLAEPLPRRARAQTAGWTALALVDLGRLDEARDLLDAELRGAEDDLHGRFDLLWASAELALATGDLARAEAVATECLDTLGSADYQDVLFMHVIRMWARTLSRHDPGLPLPDSETLEPLWAGLIPESHGIRLLHEAGPGPSGAALELAGGAADRFAEAAERFAPYHRRSEMRCRWACGEALRLAGCTTEARAVLEDAEAQAVALGMVPLQNRVRRSLRLAGVRRSAPRGRMGRLSTREAQILELVADGLTNAEIALRLGIGRPTVVRTVANASAKLGVERRAQLAALDRT